MNARPLLLLPVALLALTGCNSSGATDTEAASTPSATIAPASISTAETCEQIAPDGGDGLLTEAVDFAQDATGDGDIDDELISQARSVVDDLDPVIATAGSELRPELEKVADFPRGIIEAVESGESSIELEPEDFKAGASVLVVECMNDGNSVSSAEDELEPVEEDVAPLEEEESALAAGLKDEFPGYPLLVDATTLDYRVAAAFERTGHTGKVVALVPGVYTAYNPNIADLDKYYEGSGFYGDTMMHKEYLPGSGGSFWSGVLPSPQEPQG